MTMDFGSLVAKNIRTFRMLNLIIDRKILRATKDLFLDLFIILLINILIIKFVPFIIDPYITIIMT
jgi:hypothetical protein